MMVFSVAHGQIIQIEKTGTSETAFPKKNDKGTWIHWCNGYNDGGMSSLVGTHFHIASRWFPEDLEDYHGMFIEKIAFFPLNTTTISVRIWTGDNPTTLVYSQPVSSITPNTWNVVELDEPYEINASEGLWFGLLIKITGVPLVGWDNGQPFFENRNWRSGSAGVNWTPIENWYDWTHNWNLAAFVTGGHPVTFNVDMKDAVSACGTVFNPEIHNVHISGEFSNWQQPGTNLTFKLSPPGTFIENWDSYKDFTTDLSPWIVVDVHGENTWGAAHFSWPGESSAFGWMVMNPQATEPPLASSFSAVVGTKYVFSVTSEVDPPLVEENKWLISPQVKVSHLSELSFYARSYTDYYGLERIKVYVSPTGDPDIGSFEKINQGDYIEVPVNWTRYTYDLASYAGSTIRFAVENVSTDAFMLFLDGFKVTNIFGDDSDKDIYALILNLDPGTYEYKFYITEGDSPCWDMAEWVGGPNRSIFVEGSMVKDHTFGVPCQVNIDNIISSGLKIFPNPATLNLNVQSEYMFLEVRILDLSGRIVYSQVVKDNVIFINVSDFITGMYFIQIIGENQCVTQKIQVIR